MSRASLFNLTVLLVLVNHLKVNVLAIEGEFQFRNQLLCYVKKQIVTINQNVCTVSARKLANYRPVTDIPCTLFIKSLDTFNFWLPLFLFLREKGFACMKSFTKCESLHMIVVYDAFQIKKKYNSVVNLTTCSVLAQFQIQTLYVISKWISFCV